MRYERKALLATHHEGDRIDLYSAFLRREGYDVIVARTLPEVLNAATEGDYDLFTMDLNLGFPGRCIVGPAVKVSGVLEQRIIAGKAHFLGFSSDRTTIQVAKEAGIAACLSTEFNTFTEYLS